LTTYDDIRAIAQKLPGSIEGDGRFGFGVMVRGKVKGYTWTWMERIHPKKPKVENPRVLAVVTPTLLAKELLLGSGTDYLFTEPHYDGFAAVLVRLDVIKPDQLEPLLIEAYRSKVLPKPR
jgi:hypothetical protein